MNLHHCTVLTYDDETGRYTVKDSVSKAMWNASLLTPVPRGKTGFGMKSVPKVPFNTPCIVAKWGDTHFILGFDLPTGATQHGNDPKAIPIKEGDTILQGGRKTFMGIMENGIVMFQTFIDTTRVIFDPIREKLSFFARQFYFEGFNWFISTTTDMIKDLSTITFKYTKGLDTTANPVNSAKAKKDSITFTLGDVDETGTLMHILETDVKQDYLMKAPKVAMHSKYGYQDATSKKIFEHITTSKENTAQTVITSLEIQETGALLYKIAAKNVATLTILKDGDLTYDITRKDEKNQSTVTLLPDGNLSYLMKQEKVTGTLKIEPTADFSYAIKAEKVETTLKSNAQGDFTFTSKGDHEVSLTILQSGDITIKTNNPEAKIKLGGTGNEQQLVTKAWLDQVFMNHMHPSAAMGPPSPPLPIPAVVAADAKTNFFTFTTLGE